MPVRVQRKRTKGWKMPPNTVYVGRPSRWGNPWTVEEHGATVAVDIFRRWLDNRKDRKSLQLIFRNYDQSTIEDIANLRARLLDDIGKLRGKNLACWCPIISHGIYRPCHADVLLSITNDIPMEEVIRENTRWAEGQTV